MPDTLLASLASALKPSTPEVARSLGEPEQAVSRGFELATAAVFEGLARKTKDPDMLRRVIDLASKTPANLKPTAVSAGQLTDPNSPLITDGKRLLSNLFGNREDALLASVSRESGLRAGTTPVVLAVAAQSVLSFLGTRVRDEGMTGTELAGFLRSSAAGLRSSLPPELRETFTTSPPGVHEPSPVIAQAIDTDPVVFQTERKERSLLPWLLVPLALILLGLLWYAFRPHRLPVAVAPVPSAPVAETPAPVAPAAPDLGNLVSRQLVNGTRLSIPANGVEGRLLAFIQDPSSTPDKTTWFDFDRLLFDTGSATLQPQSDEQLHNIAAILKAYPNVHLKIGGYTDNVGSAAANLQLSQDRATAVMRQLVNLGISPNRLSAQGYGEDHAVGDNSTDAGRALNRRVSMLVTQK